MDAIITARVPVEVKEQVNEILKEIGATQTQLVNAAYDYVLSQRELPIVRPPLRRASRMLTAEQKRDLRERVESMTFAVPEDFWAGRSYKDIIAEGKAADYEALA